MTVASSVKLEPEEIRLAGRRLGKSLGFGNLKSGKVKNPPESRIQMAMPDDAIDAIRDGLHTRIRGLATGQVNMIRPANVQIVEVQK